MKSFNSYISPTIIQEALDYHVENQIPYTECQFRYGSEKYFEYFQEVRNLYKEGLIEVNEEEIEILESDLGTFDYYEGELVPLDFIIGAEQVLEEESTPELNKPKRGGKAKYIVYVRNPATGNIKKIQFGDTTGLTAKYNNPERKKAFAARHNCSDATDKTSKKYWACRVNKYLGTTSAARSGYW